MSASGTVTIHAWTRLTNEICYEGMEKNCLKILYVIDDSKRMELAKDFSRF